MNICSLSQGETEPFAALDAAGELVGISRECDYPPEVRTKPALVHPTIDSERRFSLEIDQQVKTAIATEPEIFRLGIPFLPLLPPNFVIIRDLCYVCAFTSSQLQHAIAAAIGRPNGACAYAARLRVVRPGKIHAPRSSASDGWIPCTPESTGARKYSRSRARRARLPQPRRRSRSPGGSVLAAALNGEEPSGTRRVTADHDRVP